MSEPDLPTLQRWMAHLIKHPVTADVASNDDEARALIERGAAVGGEIVRPSRTQEPLERLQVYNGGYLARLIEVLESDFDVLKHALGDDGWQELARDYVYRHPSHHPNLNEFGQHLAAFVAERRDLPQRVFLTELATLQWAVTKSFDAPEFEPLDIGTLAAVSADQWPSVVFQANPSVRLLQLEYPVNGYLQAVWDDEDPDLPEPEPSWLLVNRKEDRVWRTGLPEPVYRILHALVSGKPFGEALTAAGDADVNVQRWFQEWSADGVFESAEIPAA